MDVRGGESHPLHRPRWCAPSGASPPPPPEPIDASVSGPYPGTEKNPPANIVWFPFSDPLSNGASGIPQNTNAAQFIADAWGIANNTGLCGEVAISAILRAILGDVSVQDVVDNYLDAIRNSEIVGHNPGDLDPNYTGPGELQQFIDKRYGDVLDVELPLWWPHWIEDFQAYQWRTEPGKVRDLVRGWLEANQFSIAGVETVNGSSGSERGGWVGDTARPNRIRILHWVVIAGISLQFDRQNAMSRWNWFRIYNPFDNQTEYSWFPHFMQAREAGGNFSVVAGRQVKDG